MKQPIENRLSQDSLRRLYPLPEGFTQRTQYTLQTLSTQKELPMKRKLSFALVFLLLVLLAFVMALTGRINRTPVARQAQ